MPNVNNERQEEELSEDEVHSVPPNEEQQSASPPKKKSKKRNKESPKNILTKEWNKFDALTKKFWSAYSPLLSKLVEEKWIEIHVKKQVHNADSLLLDFLNHVKNSFSKLAQENGYGLIKEGAGKFACTVVHRKWSDRMYTRRKKANGRNHLHTEKPTRIHQHSEGKQKGKFKRGTLHPTSDDDLERFYANEDNLYVNN